LDQVKDRIEEEGESIGQFLREAFDILQRDEQLAYNRGKKEGYEVAKKRYAIYVQCIGCGEPVAVVDKQLKETAGEAFLNYCCLQALHGDCPVPKGSNPEDCTIMKGEKSPEG